MSTVASILQIHKFWAKILEVPTVLKVILSIYYNIFPFLVQIKTEPIDELVYEDIQSTSNGMPLETTPSEGVNSQESPESPAQSDQISPKSPEEHSQTPDSIPETPSPPENLCGTCDKQIEASTSISIVDSSIGVNEKDGLIKFAVVFDGILSESGVKWYKNVRILSFC